MPKFEKKSLSEKDIQEYLAMYGPEIEFWPENLQGEGMKARQNPTFAALIQQQWRFEELLQKRGYELSHPEFADRIIAKARPVRQQFIISTVTRLTEILAEFLIPKPDFFRPVLTFSMLVAGVVIGFSLSEQMIPGREDFSMQTYLEDNGAIL